MHLTPYAGVLSERDSFGPGGDQSLGVIE